MSESNDNIEEPSAHFSPKKTFLPPPPSMEFLVRRANMLIKKRGHVVCIFVSRQRNRSPDPVSDDSSEGRQPAFA